VDLSCLKYGLTCAERAQFNKNGYIIIKNALDPDKVAQYVGTIKKHYKPPGFCFIDAAVQEDKAFLDIVDNPKILPKIWDILGWNIYLQHSHASLTPFCGNKNDKSLDQWHRDGGRIGEDVNPFPLVSVKVGYSLSDTLKPRMGSLLVVPGSHLIKGDANFKNKVEVLAKAGDATIFDQRIWHAPGSNCSDIPRFAIFCAYSYRWMRPHDIYDKEFVDAIEDPVRKQLLGHHGARPTGYSYYHPNLDDAPLWEFFIKHKIKG
jgi:ectoine hydroxylase-related dioxygenase (phytanoyl-CoA dioxygenase family)